MKAQLLTKKNAFYAGQKDVIALLKLSPEDLKINKKLKIKKNLSFVIDISTSMGGMIKNNVNIWNNVNLIGAARNPGKTLPDTPIYPTSPFITPDPFAPTLKYGGSQDKINMVSAALGSTQDDKDTLQAQDDLQNYLNNMNKRKVLQDQAQVKVAPVIERMRNRLELVVDATKVAICQLDSDDYASIVLFGSDVSVLCPSMPMNAENKAMFLAALNTVHVSGMTNLHGGWVKGVEEVAKNLSSEYINRVIVLTDGETNTGETNPDVIASNVAGAYKHSVTTTTIGVGEGFNEDLLQGMATSGSGNSYFIDDDASVKRTFETEFTGLSNVNAKEIKVKFEGKGSLKLVKNMNLYQKDGDYFKFPTLSSQEINAVFVLEAGTAAKKSLHGIKVTIQYKDSNGKAKKITLEQGLDLNSKKSVESMEENQEVKVQELLNTIAEQKIQARQAYESGNLVGATDMLARSAMVTSAMASALAPDSMYGQMLNTEVANLNSLSAKAGVAGDKTFSKDLSYQSYRTRNAQDRDNQS